MHWIDIVILVVVAVATFLGLKIGIIKAVLSLVGLIVGVILAGRYYAPLAERLTFITQDTIASGVAFAIILIGVMIIAGVLAALLKWTASAMLLGWVNHLGGAVLGLVLGAILCGALLTIWVNFLGMPEVIKESTLAVILHDRFPAVLALLPDEFEAIRSFFQ
jgi:membrane protein required for colicin V production